MIDHVSIPISHIDRAAAFYARVLAPLGYVALEIRPTTVGFGKTYAELWVNLRDDAAARDAREGAHVALRAASPAAVDEFHAAALAAGGVSDGAPGLRPAHEEGYYAAFIRDPDGNRIEAVTFVR